MSSRAAGEILHFHELNSSLHDEQTKLEVYNYWTARKKREIIQQAPMDCMFASFTPTPTNSLGFFYVQPLVCTGQNWSNEHSPPFPGISCS